MRNNESYERMVQTLKRNVALKRTLQKMHLKYACLKEHIPFEPCDLSFEWITILCASPLFTHVLTLSFLSFRLKLLLWLTMISLC